MDPTGAREVPREFWLGVELANRRQAFNILGPTYFTLHPVQCMYRLYMSFCPHGDLAELMSAHKHFEGSDHRDQKDRKLKRYVKAFPIRSLVRFLIWLAVLSQSLLHGVSLRHWLAQHA